MRRELYATLPKRLIHALHNQHFAFLGVLASIALTAASSVVAELARNLGGGVRTMTALRSAYYLLHLLPAYFFSVFLIDLCGPAKKRGPRFWWAYSLPLLLGAVLAAVNPLTRFCFIMTGGGAVQRSGPGMWVLFSVAVFYLAAGFLYFFRFCREMTKAERRAALVLMTVVLLGVVIQAVWSAPVELFFEAIAFFGFMALLEHDRDASENGMSRRFRGSAVVALAFTFFAVIVVNITLIQGINRSQADKLGNIRLDVIRGDLEDTVTTAENNLLRVAVDAENLLNANASHEQISEYITRQKERFLADESFTTQRGRFSVFGLRYSLPHVTWLHFVQHREPSPHVSKENSAGQLRRSFPDAPGVQPEASPCVRGKDSRSATGKRAGPGVYFRVTATAKSEKYGWVMIAPAGRSRVSFMSNNDTSGNPYFSRMAFSSSDIMA